MESGLCAYRGCLQGIQKPKEFWWRSGWPQARYRFLFRTSAKFWGCAEQEGEKPTWKFLKGIVELLGSFMRKKIQSLRLRKGGASKIIPKFQIRTLKGQRQFRDCLRLIRASNQPHFSKILTGVEDSTTPLFALQRDSDSSLKEYIIIGCVMSTNLFLIHHVQHAMKNCQGWPEHMNKNRKRYPDTINRFQGRPVFWRKLIRTFTTVILITMISMFKKIEKIEKNKVG